MNTRPTTHNREVKQHTLQNPHDPQIDHRSTGASKTLAGQSRQVRKIRTDFYNGKAGFGGEREFDYQLRDFIPPYPHAILHDIFLKHEHAYFQ